MAKEKSKISKRKFYKTTYTFVVLSEDPIKNKSLSDVLEETDAGDMVGHVAETKSVEIDAKQMVEELNEAGSDSTFFQLTEDGEDDK